MTIYSFLIASVMIIISPGTGVMYTISTGINQGKRGGILAAVGCTAGIIPHLCVSIALSTLLMTMNQRVFLIVKYAGALYLLYMGIGMLVSKAKTQQDDTVENQNLHGIIKRGVMINLLNPKLTLFFFSFLPQYGQQLQSSDSTNSVFRYGFAGLLFMLVTLIVFIGYGVLAGAARQLIIGKPKLLALIQKSFGLIFIWFALSLAVGTMG